VAAATPRKPDVRWWAGPAGLALVGVLAGVDALWGPARIITATVVIAPFVTALSGSARQTLVVALAAVAACALSGSWNENYGTQDYLLRLLVVAAGSALAVAAAEGRQRLATDRRRFHLLAAVAGVTETSASIGETVRRLTDLLVPDIADVAVIDVVRDGRPERLAVAAHGPLREQLEAALMEQPLGAEQPGRASAALRTGRALLVPDAAADAGGAEPGDEPERAWLRSFGGRSAIVVPLRARAQRIGSLALVLTGASRRRYEDDDFDFATVLSGRIALALDNAGLFAELETVEAQRAAALGNLAEAVTIQDAQGALVYANEAAARALGFSSPEDLLATPVPEIVDAFDSFHEDGSPLDLRRLPGRRALAGEQPEPLLIRAIHKRTGEERWRLTKATAVLDADGRPRLAVNVIEDVTGAKRAERASRLLAEAGAVLASSLDYEETLNRVARLAVPELADWCGVSLPDERGFIRSVAVAHVDPAKVAFAREYNARYPSHVDDPIGSAQVLREGRSQLMNEIPDELLAASIPDPERLAQVRALGMRSAMIVPMIAGGTTIGTIALVTAESGRSFTTADLELAEELGRRAGTAIENARLYRERSQIARTLQSSLLPAELPAIPGFELASLYRPAGAENWVGGDFYDAVRTETGWMLTVGDVAGHGAEAAALTAQARHTLRTGARLLGDPVAAIRELNESLAAADRLAVCTVVCVLLEERAAGARATIVCAGHPLPLLLRDGRVTPVGRWGTMVGAWRDSTWVPDVVELAPRDQLVLYTDGVTDARGADGRFGEARLREALEGAGGSQDAVRRIEAALDAFETGAQADDTAVVVLARSAALQTRGDRGGRPQADDGIE
jgi:PAS domain S-box-containing protein